MSLRLRRQLTHGGLIRDISRAQNGKSGNPASINRIEELLLEYQVVQRVFRTFCFESVAIDPILKPLPPALPG
jgi:hypothetical protein